MAKVPPRSKSPLRLSRKHAAMARSRAQIIAGAQEVLALVGPQATVDQIAEASNVATSTIYLHFRDRESLFAEALVTAHATWEKWAMGVAATLPRPLDQFVTMARLFVRGGSTHPQYGKMVAHSIGEIGAQLPNFTKGIGVHIELLEKSKVLVAKGLPLRAEAFATCLFGEMIAQLRSTDAKRADEVVEIALSLLSIPPAEAKRLAHAPLPRLPKVLSRAQSR